MFGRSGNNFINDDVSKKYDPTPISRSSLSDLSNPSKECDPNGTDIKRVNPNQIEREDPVPDQIERADNEPFYVFKPPRPPRKG